MMPYRADIDAGLPHIDITHGDVAMMPARPEAAGRQVPLAIQARVILELSAAKAAIGRCRLRRAARCYIDIFGREERRENSSRSWCRAGQPPATSLDA